MSIPKPRETVTVLRDDLVRVLDYARQFDVDSDDAMARVTEAVLSGPVPVVAPGAAQAGRGSELPAHMPWLWEASSWLRRIAAQREAEERGRREWIEGVKQRLGLVVAGDLPAVVVHRDWPEGCRCVIMGGLRVSLGGPCPAHSERVT
ncbi:MAG TPA: hypothetical protein VK586_24080 [Streptosporangiaceae bacterium]|nr:hypothetical protein [Streptosporangiaceae bacterium]